MKKEVHFHHFNWQDFWQMLLFLFVIANAISLGISIGSRNGDSTIVTLATSIFTCVVFISWLINIFIHRNGN